jgi:nitroreductase
MIDLPAETFRSLVAEVRRSPSVHNVQPTRWRHASGGITLLEDTRRMLPAADPKGADLQISHGAALEGMAIALQRVGLMVSTVERLAAEAEGPFRPLAHLTLAPAVLPPPFTLNEVENRATWRGMFQPVTSEQTNALERLAASTDDLRIITAPQDISDAARLSDLAGMTFLRDDAHRQELLGWMRLSPSHPDAARDGLNCDALGLSPAAAFGARLVLGPMFRTLDRFWLARPLLTEAPKIRSAPALALFHRPSGEDRLETGRAFYRAWLLMERFGLAACPISALADWPQSNVALAEAHGLPLSRRLVNVFRLGVAAEPKKREAARLPVDELIV